MELLNVSGQHKAEKNSFVECLSTCTEENIQYFE